MKKKVSNLKAKKDAEGRNYTVAASGVGGREEPQKIEITEGTVLEADIICEPDGVQNCRLV